MYLSDPLQWIALAWAIVNPAFKSRLFREVGPNAFDGLSRDVFDQLETLDSEYQQRRLRALLDLGADGKLSDVVLRYLEGVAADKWAFRFHRRGHGHARFLHAIIKEATAQLAALARNDGERIAISEPPSEFEQGEGI